MDPGLVRLAAFARNRGFARLFALRKRWPPAYRALFPEAGRQEGVEMVAVDSAGTRGRSDHRLVALPVPLEPDTMYVIYSTRHTAVDHFVHDKACTTEWLPQHLGDARPPVRSVFTRHEPFTPPPQEDPRWPDLVIKLASWDRGDFVRFVKLKPGEDVLPQLGMKRPSDVPGIFRMGAGRRLVSYLTARDTVLYQPFLPIGLDEAGRPIRFRMNVLATPVGGAFLSANAIVSAVPLPAELPYGPVRDADPFLVSYSHGSRYQTCDPATEEELRGVAEVLVSALDRAVRATFETGP
jgi:hypothetical protein